MSNYQLVPMELPTTPQECTCCDRPGTQFVMMPGTNLGFPLCEMCCSPVVEGFRARMRAIEEITACGVPYMSAVKSVLGKKEAAS